MRDFGANFSDEKSEPIEAFFQTLPALENTETVGFSRYLKNARPGKAPPAGGIAVGLSRTSGKARESGFLIKPRLRIRAL